MRTQPRRARRGGIVIGGRDDLMEMAFPRSLLQASDREVDLELTSAACSSPRAIIGTEDQNSNRQCMDFVDRQGHAAFRDSASFGGRRRGPASESAKEMSSDSDPVALIATTSPTTWP